MTLSTPVLAPEDLAAITADVWAAFLLSADAEPLLPVAPVPLAGDAVHATVQVTGSWTGRIDLALGAASADLATRTLLRLPADVPAQPADVADAVGELANMVGGNVKSLVPAPSSLGLPVVGRGTFPVGGPVECAVDLDWAGHVVHVVVRSA